MIESPIRTAMAVHEKTPDQPVFMRHSSFPIAFNLQHPVLSGNLFCWVGWWDAYTSSIEKGSSP